MILAGRASSSSQPTPRRTTSAASWSRARPRRFRSSKACSTLHAKRFRESQAIGCGSAVFQRRFLDHDEPSGPVVGPNAAKEMMGKAYQRWPDLHVEIEEILAEGDRVMVRNKWPATERSSGRRIEFHGFVLWRFANQTIVEPWATLTPSREL